MTDASISLHGRIVSGRGEGAYFMGLVWVRGAVERIVGFEPYPGTLNVRLTETDALELWRDIRARHAVPITPPLPETCGGSLVPLVIAPDVRAAVVVPDVTHHSEDVLEVIAGIHVRSRLGLREGDLVTLRFAATGVPCRGAR